MRKLNVYIFLLMLLLSFSCDDKSDQDLLADAIYSSTPIFYFYANDQEYKIEAGISGFYMFSEFELDTSNVYTFVARLAKLSSCEYQCDEELVIKIRDFQITGPSSSISIDESLNVGDYSFMGSQNIGFGDVSVSYMNAEGITFKTDLVEQDGESYFRILAVSDFQENENGFPTKKLDVAFRCTLINPENGFEITFQDAEAVISIAYPE